MAYVRLTAEQARRGAATDMDPAKVRATTEADIRRHAIEDGEDPEGIEDRLYAVVPPALVRAKTGLTQDEFARALRIPVKTLRNWEQGRTRPDPAARTLFALLDKDPSRLLALLGS